MIKILILEIFFYKIFWKIDEFIKKYLIGAYLKLSEKCNKK